MINLTPKQQLFVEEYLVDLNATQAAIRAGYSEKTANEQGARLLANVSVQAAIKIAMDKRSERTHITQDRVLDELAKLAFFDIRKLYDDKGNLIPITQLDDATAAAIAGIDVVEMAGGMEIGGDAAVKHVAMYTKKVKLVDKRAALVDIGKHIGMFIDRKEVGKPGDFENLSDDELERRTEAALQALGHTDAAIRTAKTAPGKTAKK